jgi:hypothetical protein
MIYFFLRSSEGLRLRDIFNVDKDIEELCHWGLTHKEGTDTNCNHCYSLNVFPKVYVLEIIPTQQCWRWAEEGLIRSWGSQKINVSITRAG